MNRRQIRFQYQAGSAAAAATMGAFYGAIYQGTGQQVDVSIMETLMGSIDRRMTYLLAYQYTGETSQRQAMEGSANYPYGVFPCGEGYLQISGQGNYFRRSVKMLGSPEFLMDPRWYAPGAQTDPELREEFYEYFTRELKNYEPKIMLSADVFAYTFLTHVYDAGIGQRFEDAALYFDVVSPMVYPSHYSSGNFGFDNPAEHPYEVILNTLEQGREKLNSMETKRGIVRPWLQAFHMGAYYGKEMVNLEKR